MKRPASSDADPRSAGLAGRAGRRAQPSPNRPKSIQIGLSTDRVRITADFSGADLTIFGSLENADPLINRQGRYDVIVVLEGPARPVVVRRKDRVSRHVGQHGVGNLRQRAGVLFGGDDPPAAGHHRSEQLPATGARRRQSAYPAAGQRRQSGDDRGIPAGAARTQDRDRTVQRYASAAWNSCRKACFAPP